MHEVTEVGAAEWIVAHVLDDRSAISIGMGFAQVFFGGVGKAFEQ